jgi:hypothetical protein
VVTAVNRAEIGRYLAWYAWQDLFAPSERKITWVICATLASSLFLIVLAGTAAVAMPEIEEHRLSTALLARSIWIGQMNNSDRHFSEERLELLRTTLAKRVPQAPPHVRGFYEVQMPLALSNEITFQRCFGRTLATDDPLLADLAARDPRISASFEGIIAADNLADYLGFTGQASPELHVRLAENLPDTPNLPLPCLLVPALRLPYGHSFLIMEKTLQKLERQSFPAKATRYLLQVPWDAYAELEGQLQDDPEFQSLLTDLKTPKPASGKVQLESNKGLLPVGQWDGILDGLAKLLLKRSPGVIPAREDWHPKPDDLTFREWTPSTTGFHYAEVRVASVNDLSAAAAACREAGYPADDVLVQQVRNVKESARILQATVLVTSFFVLLVGVIVVGALQHLRWRQKIPETGMLRILGISNRELQHISRRQGLVLCCGGNVLSMTLSAITLMALMPVVSIAEMWIIARCALCLGGGAAIASVVLICFSVQLSTRSACSISPLAALLGSDN